MNLVPYTLTALSRQDIPDTPTDRNVVVGAVVTCQDSEGATVTMFDDASGANGSTAKQTGVNGQVAVFVPAGEYTFFANGRASKVVIASKQPLSAIVSETAPQVNLKQGVRWYKPSEATTYIYYCDIDSCQWVQEPVARAVAGAGAGGTNFLNLSDAPSYLEDIDAAFLESFSSLPDGGTLVLPLGAIEISVSITVPQNVNIIGQGKFASIISRPSSSVSITMSSGASLENLSLRDLDNSGVWVTFATNSNYQYIENCVIRNNGGRVINIPADAAEELNISNCLITNQESATACIALAGVDSSARPRHFNNNQGAGSLIYDFTGMNDTFVNGGYTLGFVCGSTSSKTMMVNMRTGFNPNIGNQAIAGENHTITNVVFATPVVLTCTDSRIDAIAPDWNFIDNGTGNSIEQKFRAYQPVVTTSGAPFNLGDGALTGFYSRSGNLVNVIFELVIGGTTDVGTGIWYFSLPIQGSNLGFPYTANGSFQSPGANPARIGVVVIEEDRNTFSLVYPDNYGGSEVLSFAGSALSGNVLDISPSRYPVANGAVKVFLNGVRLSVQAGDYTETSPTEITFSQPVASTDVITIQIDKVQQFNVGGNAGNSEVWPVSSRLRGSFSYYCK